MCRCLSLCWCLGSRVCVAVLVCGCCVRVVCVCDVCVVGVCVLVFCLCWCLCRCLCSCLCSCFRVGLFDVGVCVLFCFCLYA